MLRFCEYNCTSKKVHCNDELKYYSMLKVSNAIDVFLGYAMQMLFYSTKIDPLYFKHES